MESFDLFATRLWKQRVDPTLWDKQSFVSDVAENYRRDPYRSAWVNDGTLHHCYNDWDNPNFIKYNLDQLMPLYGNIVSGFVAQLPVKKVPQYRYMVTNVTANKGGQYMGMHDHIYDSNELSCAYSCVHYVKLEPHQPNTTFYNPSIAGQFINTMSTLTNHLDMSIMENSGLAGTWTIPTQEDDFVIFPSYLKHKVQGNWKEKDPNELRITVVVNIDFFRN
jgi:hypothetical protein